MPMHVGLSDTHELVSTNLGWQQTGANMENMISLARGTCYGKGLWQLLTIGSTGWHTGSHCLILQRLGLRPLKAGLPGDVMKQTLPGVTSLQTSPRGHCLFFFSFFFWDSKIVEGVWADGVCIYATKRGEVKKVPSCLLRSGTSLNARTEKPNLSPC